MKGKHHCTLMKSWEMGDTKCGAARRGITPCEKNVNTQSASYPRMTSFNPTIDAAKLRLWDRLSGKYTLEGATKYNQLFEDRELSSIDFHQPFEKLLFITLPQRDCPYFNHYSLTRRTIRSPLRSNLQTTTSHLLDPNIDMAKLLRDRLPFKYTLT